MRALAISLMFWAAAVPAAAQQPDTTVFEMDELVVQATTPVTTTGGASALEVRLDSLRGPAAPTLDQILRRIPLVQVRVNSRGESQFSLRGSGSDARQVAVVVDGIPLNFGWDDRADLSVLPATAAQELIIARGLPSLLYGPNVLGGVVEIGIARASQPRLSRGVRLDVSSDHTGAHGVASGITLPMATNNAQWLLRAGAGYRSRDELPRPDDAAALRNTDLTHQDVFASLSYRPHSGAWADASVSAFTAERGIAAEQHVQEPRFWRYPETARLFAVVAAGTGWHASPLGGTGDVELSVGADLGHTEIDQFLSDQYDAVESQEDSDDRNLTVRMRADQTVGRTAELRAGLTYADINHDEALTPGGSATYRQQLWSAGLELHWQPQPLGAGTRVTIGAALDGAATPESGDKPALDPLRALGLRAGITSKVGDAVLLHAGGSLRSRFPSLRELYSGALGRFTPNPFLGPERLLAVEAGASLHAPRAQLQGVLFHHVLSDAIVRIATSDRRFQRVNRDRQAGTGIELLAAAQLGVFSVSGDLVLQRTRLDDGSGNHIEPEYQPAIIAGLGLAAPLPFDARIDLRARHTGSQSCINPDSDASIRLNAAQRVDAEVSRSWRARGAWTSNIEVALGADNLMDATSFDQCGLPRPGRALRVQVRVR